MLATAYCDPRTNQVEAFAHSRTWSPPDIRRLPLGTRLQSPGPGQSYAGVYAVLDTGSKI